MQPTKRTKPTLTLHSRFEALFAATVDYKPGGGGNDSRLVPQLPVRPTVRKMVGTG